MGVYANTVLMVIAPVVDKALPSSVSPALILIAALFAITVPFIDVPEAMLTSPSIFQNTLQANAPFISFTFESALVEKGPWIWKINTAPAFPWASRRRSPLNVAAADTE